MEVTLKAGDSLNIPEGCKAVIKDGSVVFEKGEKEEVQKFKDGDVLVAIVDDIAHPFIFFKTSENCCWYHACLYPNGEIYRAWFFRSTLANVRFATQEEKRQLFDKIREKGRESNAEKQSVDLIRWKAKEGEPVYFLNLHQDESIVSKGVPASVDYLWNTYNYFRTQEQTIEAAKRVQEALRQYHEEIGE